MTAGDEVTIVTIASFIKNEVILMPPPSHLLVIGDVLLIRF